MTRAEVWAWRIPLPSMSGAFDIPAGARFLEAMHQ